MAPQDQFSGRAVFQSAQQRRPPMPPPAPPRAPAGRAPGQQAYASANPNASFQRAPARPPMPPVPAQRSTAMAQPVATGGGPRNFGPGTAQTVNDPWMNAIGPVRTLPAPAPAAYANANPNASFQQQQLAPSLAAQNRMDMRGTQAYQTMQQQQAAQGGVTAADMVDVPGYGPMPRSLLNNLQQRLQQRQQPAPLVQALQSGPEEVGWSGGPPVRAQSGDPVLQAKVDKLQQMVQSGQMSDAEGQARLNQLLANAYTTGGGPPVRAMPADNRYVGTPYGNDNRGVGGVRPPTEFDRGGPYVPPRQNPVGVTMPINQNPPPPPPPVAAAPSQFPNKPAPGNPNDYYWDAAKGDWTFINRAAEAAARNVAMVPPAPPVSPIAGHLWGGGPEAFGAGRSPLAASMGDFYSVYGGGRPGAQLPTQQQLYDQFNANPQNPYQISGAVNNGNTVFPQPSYY